MGIDFITLRKLRDAPFVQPVQQGRLDRHRAGPTGR
jgi:hypothetical protein